MWLCTYVIKNGKNMLKMKMYGKNLANIFSVKAAYY